MLFPEANGPVAIIANAGNLFPRHLARLWRGMGIDARIVTRHWETDERVLPDGTPLHVTTDSESPQQRRMYRWLELAASTLERPLMFVQRERYQLAMGSERSYRPSISPAVADALSIVRYVDELRPQFVCGQEVFSYGLATAFSRNTPRVLMPWGGDVYMYANTTSVASAAVRYALNHVELVVPGSPIATEHLHERFGVPHSRMHCGGLWALDQQRFRRAEGGDRPRVCAAFGIDPAKLIVMNVRRFFPAWGSDLALRVYLRFAAEWPMAHFLLLGGGGTDAHVAEARATIAVRGFSDRFTFLDGDRPIEEVAAAMSVADIFTSFMRELDMRPFASILEASACGAAPIIGEQPEYRAMERAGFSAALCPPDDETAAVEALRMYSSSSARREETARRNQLYLERHENGQDHARALLERIRSICDAYHRTSPRA
jgi:glycosyltransferase involved in cell wall biosynthesis